MEIEEAQGKRSYLVEKLLGNAKDFDQLHELDIRFFEGLRTFIDFSDFCFDFVQGILKSG